jgi:hypothetical protein
MLSRHVTLVLWLLLSAAVASEASAAEETDTRHPKPCGGYYACLELQPSQPGQWGFFVANPESPSP